MATYLVLSAQALDEAAQVTAATWSEAVALAAEQDTASGRFVCIPATAIKHALVELQTQPKAIVTEDTGAA